MVYSELQHRLHEGRPLVLGSDIEASLRARGHNLDAPGSLGALLHRNPAHVRAHHQAELLNRVDIISALTADTTPRALSEAAMEHRAARLTGDAIDLAAEVASEQLKPTAVAGILGSSLVGATHRIRLDQETREHAERLAAAGIELILVRGVGSLVDLLYSVATVARLDIPCWAVVDETMARDGLLPELAASCEAAGAEALLLEVDSVDLGLRYLAALAPYAGPLVKGALLNAASGSVRGFPEPLTPTWVERAVELTHSGARIIGGGAGTTSAHTCALAARLGGLHPSMLPPRFPTA